MSTPDVSILMPVRDGLPFVHEAVASVLDGAPGRVELIVVDDRSRDGTPEALRDLGRRRLRLIESEGTGIAAAFNTGLAAARGRYVARCDADDRFEPGRLARQLAWLDRHREFAAVCGGFATMNRRGRFVADLRCGDEPAEITDEMVHGGVRTSLCTFMVRRGVLEAIGGCRAWFRTAEDIDLQLRLAERGRVMFDPARVYLYRLHDDSITHATGTALKDFYHETALLLQRQRRETGADDLERGRPPRPPEHASARTGSRDQMQGQLLGAAWSQHAAGRRREALRTGVRACLARPTNLGAWKSLGALARPPAANETGDEPGQET